MTLLNIARMRQRPVLIERQHIADQFVVLPGDTHVLLVEQALVRVVLEGKAFWKNPQVDLSAAEALERFGSMFF